eukprot:TRINITY_DN108409_c0_g1_i1.p1 TRINITY_DN108409_c0_g1~~TRINITY_DN108409_c0_g1_i1.p1  ORF type:complete len:140 (-),score=18.18 TRINITY_DN108409_c0_g1_i1:190-609(-)
MSSCTSSHALNPDMPLSTSVNRRFQMALTVVPVATAAEHRCACALQNVPDAFVQILLREAADILLKEAEQTATTTYIEDRLSPRARSLLRVPAINLTRALQCYCKDFLVTQRGGDTYASYVYNLNGKDADHPPGRYISL